MDPDATLAELRSAVRSHDHGHPADCDRLLELVRALDDWLTRGGGLPAPWIH